MRCRGPSAITTQAPLARGRARTLCFTISSLRGRDTKIVRASNIKTLPLCPMERAQAGGTNRDSCRRGEFPLRATTGHTTTTCLQGALRFCWNCFSWRARCRHRHLRRHRLSRQTPRRFPHAGAGNASRTCVRGGSCIERSCSRGAGQSYGCRGQRWCYH